MLVTVVVGIEADFDETAAVSTELDIGETHVWYVEVTLRVEVT